MWEKEHYSWKSIQLELAENIEFWLSFWLGEEDLFQSFL